MCKRQLSGTHCAKMYEQLRLNRPFNLLIYMCSTEQTLILAMTNICDEIVNIFHYFAKSIINKIEVRNKNDTESI